MLPNPCWGTIGRKLSTALAAPISFDYCLNLPPAPTPPTTHPPHHTTPHHTSTTPHHLPPPSPGAAAMTSYYFSLQLLPLADAVTLFFLNPAVTAV